MIPRLKHRTLSAAIADQLRKDILDGSHPAGTQLRQDALAAAFGVSRIPVREALFQLEAEGLVRITPQRGAVVADFSVAEIDDVFELRCVLEPRLLLRSAPAFNAEDFARLDEIHNRFIAAIAAKDVTSWGVINEEFHLALYSRADLPRTQTIVASLLQISDRYTRLQLSNTTSMGRAETEHAELIALCRAGNIEEACRFLAQHIGAVRVDLLSVIKERATPAAPHSELAGAAVDGA